MPAMYELLLTMEFATWFIGMKDLNVRAVLQRRIGRAAKGALGDVKPVGEGVYEMREFIGAGWRIYYTLQGKRLIILLCGGDKSTQQQDIKRAKEIAKRYRGNDHD